MSDKISYNVKELLSDIGIKKMDDDKINYDLSSFEVYEKPVVPNNNVPNYKYNRELERFINLIKTDNADTGLLYNNMNSLQIAPIKIPIYIFLFMCSPEAEYDIEKNAIFIKNRHEYSVMHHELNHVASSIYQNGVLYSAFSQYNLDKKTAIGGGICEGYTDVLTNRQTKTRQEFLLDIYNASAFIESLIGRINMVKYYYTADLLGLINSLKKYDSEENIMDFIANLDELYDRTLYSPLMRSLADEKRIKELEDRLFEFQEKMYHEASHNNYMILKPKRNRIIK